MCPDPKDDATQSSQVTNGVEGTHKGYLDYIRGREDTDQIQIAKSLRPLK